MITIPKWLVSHEGAAELLQWRLSVTDVAQLLMIKPRRLQGWLHDGHPQTGIIMEHRRFSNGLTSPRVFRLKDVQDFAEMHQLEINLEGLHPALQREWGVGPFAKKEEHHE